MSEELMKAVDDRIAISRAMDAVRGYPELAVHLPVLRKIHDDICLIIYRIMREEEPNQ